VYATQRERRYKKCTSATDRKPEAVNTRKSLLDVVQTTLEAFLVTVDPEFSAGSLLLFPVQVYFAAIGFSKLIFTSEYIQ